MEPVPQNSRRRSSARSIKEETKNFFAGITTRIESKIKRSFSTLTFSSDKGSKSPDTSFTPTEEKCPSPAVDPDSIEPLPILSDVGPVVGPIVGPVVRQHRRQGFYGPSFHLAQVEMNSSLDPRSAFGSKTKQIQEAEKMQVATAERVVRAGAPVPPYEFLELIGKGSFGRVFKRQVFDDLSNDTCFINRETS